MIAVIISSMTNSALWTDLGVSSNAELKMDVWIILIDF